MAIPNKSIINYIPDFLEYCKKEKDLSPVSLESYSKFLNPFILWIRKSNLPDLTPEKLSLEHIKQYKEHLSGDYDSPKSISSQNSYLIAIRSLLSYFIEKGIQSLLPNNIKLYREKKSRPSSENKILSSRQLEKLLKMPNTSTKIGLRDKVILETLFSTGLKVSQLVVLNRDQIKIDPNSKNLEIKILSRKISFAVYLSERTIYWLRRYLKTRQDKEKALFINYRRKKGTPRRLTARSIQKIVKKYITKIGTSFIITPETLRNVYIFNLLSCETEIKIAHNPLSHKRLNTNSYKFVINGDLAAKIKSSKIPSWHTVERVINKEINWLKNNILVLPGSYKKNPSLLNCDNCLFRKIAILIVSGKIKATELKIKSRNDLWNNLTTQESLQTISKHGQHWHRKMMDVISKYFKAQNYEVVFEPILKYGRADLGIYPNLDRNKALYIEIGTVSLFKLWYNLSTMKKITFLIVPSEKYAIEFKVL